MQSLTAALDTALRAVAPIIGISIGRMDDRRTWRIDFAPEATQSQRDAAASVIAAFDVAAVEAAEAAEAAAINTLALATRGDAVFQSLRQATAAEISAHINTTFPTSTLAQRNVLKLLVMVAAAVLRKGII